MPTQFNDLRALFINCSLKSEATESHTRRLIARSAGIMRAEGLRVDVVHALEHDIPFGMATDMTEHGRDRDDWPGIQEQIDAAGRRRVAGTGQRRIVVARCHQRSATRSWALNAATRHR